MCGRLLQMFLMESKPNKTNEGALPPSHQPATHPSVRIVNPAVGTPLPAPSGMQSTPTLLAYYPYPNPRPAATGIE